MVRVENIKLLNNWKLYTLQEMLDAEIILSHLDGNHGELYPNKDEFIESGVPYLSANCIVDDEVDFTKTKFLTQKRANTFKKGVAINDDVLFAHNATVGPVAILKTNLDFVILSTTLTYYRCNKKFLLPNYLRLYMISDFFVNQYKEVMRQATRNQVPITKQRTFFHLVPPLPEQQHIVNILDQAFAKIAKAKADAEQNLKNAKELFESYLKIIFENTGKNWEEKTLNQISDNLDSKRVPITKNVRNEGSIPYYGASGIVDYVADYLFDEDLLCVSEDGANLLARTYPIAFSITGKTWVNNHAHILRFNNPVIQKFVELYLNSIKLDDFVSGMAQPKLNQAMLNKIPIPYPPFDEQQAIVQKISALSAETKRLEAIYQKKIDDLEELKKSILQKAFAGEFKTEKAVAV